MTTAPAFDDLDTESQVEILRDVARDAAPEFGLDVQRLDLVLHGFNTTFEVVTGAGRRLALRVNTNSLATPEQLRAQQAWVHAIATETDIRVPDAVRTADGRAFATVRSAAAGREFRVVVNTWLDGPDVGEPDADQARALGRVMATLHRQAQGWSAPPGTGLPAFTEPLLGDEDRLGTVLLHDVAGREVLDEAMRRAHAAFAAVLDTAAPIAIHGDLHGGNLKWHGGRLAVFDFDDSGMCVPAVDLAVATFYLRRGDGGGDEGAMRAGYAEVAALPEVEHEVFEALVVSRQLLLANSLLTSSTPQFRAMAPEYLDRTVDRLRHWFVSKRFRLDPPPS